MWKNILASLLNKKHFVGVTQPSKYYCNMQQIKQYLKFAYRLGSEDSVAYSRIMADTKIESSRPCSIYRLLRFVSVNKRIMEHKQ